MGQLRMDLVNGETVFVITDKILQWRINKLIKKISDALMVDEKKIKTCLTVSIGDEHGIKIHSKSNK